MVGTFDKQFLRQKEKRYNTKKNVYSGLRDVPCRFGKDIYLIPSIFSRQFVEYHPKGPACKALDVSSLALFQREISKCTVRVSRDW